jgi:hypothetical protein
MAAVVPKQKIKKGVLRLAFSITIYITPKNE